MYLETLNSSTKISSVEIYKNVPTDTDKKIPDTNSPSYASIHPIIIPIGLSVD